MTKQITFEEALELVSFYHRDDCGWQVRAVFGNIYGNVGGIVCGTINGYDWHSVETTKQKFQRLITESSNQELIDTFNQLEEN